jgi:hypothetical protein
LKVEGAGEEEASSGNASGKSREKVLELFSLIERTKEILKKYPILR